jgi:hypothetical protein
MNWTITAMAHGMDSYRPDVQSGLAAGGPSAEERRRQQRNAIAERATLRSSQRARRERQPKGGRDMHAVTRSYTGSGAKELIDLLEQRTSEVEGILRAVTGFVAYTLIRTDDGGVTVTVCQDKAGTDESIRMARDWIRENASDLGTSPPAISEGRVILHMS